MGGLLGPADGLYQDLGEMLSAEGIDTLRVSYLKPNDLELCIEDAGAAIALAAGQGAAKIITMGHSFGGAVAIQAGVAALNSSSLPDIAGVVTLATQAAGCEVADQLNGVPVLLIHGGSDQILSHQASQLVQSICGTDSCSWKLPITFSSLVVKSFGPCSRTGFRSSSRSRPKRQRAKDESLAR